jgi:hypothetical protein
MNSTFSRRFYFVCKTGFLSLRVALFKNSYVTNSENDFEKLFLNNENICNNLLYFYIIYIIDHNQSTHPVSFQLNKGQKC